MVYAMGMSLKLVMMSTFTCFSGIFLCELPFYIFAPFFFFLFFLSSFFFLSLSYLFVNVLLCIKVISSLLPVLHMCSLFLSFIF